MAQLQNPGGSYDWYFHQSQNSHYPPPFQSKTLSSAYNQSYNYHPQWPQPPYSSTAFQMRTLSSTYHPHQPPFNYPGFSSPQASYAYPNYTIPSCRVYQQPQHDFVSLPLPKPPDRISGQDGFDNKVIVEAHHQQTEITQDTSKSNVHHVEKLMDSSTWKVTNSLCNNMIVGEVVDSQVEKEKVEYQMLPEEDDKIAHHVFEKMPESTHKGNDVDFGSTKDVEKLKMITKSICEANDVNPHLSSRKDVKPIDENVGSTLNTMNDEMETNEAEDKGSVCDAEQSFQFEKSWQSLVNRELISVTKNRAHQEMGSTKKSEQEKKVSPVMDKEVIASNVVQREVHPYYSDAATYRLFLSEDTKALNQLNTLLQEEKRMTSILYTYRSFVKALTQLPESMKHSQAGLYLETYQVLELENLNNILKHEGNYAHVKMEPAGEEKVEVVKVSSQVEEKKYCGILKLVYVKKEPVEERKVKVEDGDFLVGKDWYLDIIIIGNLLVTTTPTSKGRKLEDNTIVTFTYSSAINWKVSYIVRFSTKRGGEIDSYWRIIDENYLDMLLRMLLHKCVLRGWSFDDLDEYEVVNALVADEFHSKLANHYLHVFGSKVIETDKWKLEHRLVCLHLVRQVLRERKMRLERLIEERKKIQKEEYCEELTTKKKKRRLSSISSIEHWFHNDDDASAVHDQNFHHTKKKKRNCIDWWTDGLNEDLKSVIGKRNSQDSGLWCDASVQSVVKLIKKDAKRAVLKKNPLKNLKMILKLKLHAKTAKKISLLAEEVSDLPLECCIGIMPPEQNIGAFFIAVLCKISPLPEFQEKPNSKGNLSSKPAESIEKCESQEFVIIVDAVAYENAAPGDRLFEVTVMLRAKFRNYLQAVVEKLVENNKLQKTIMLKKILQDYKESVGDSDIRNKMNNLKEQLTKTVNHVHSVCETHAFIALSRGYWDRMGQIVLSFLENRKENRAWYKGFRVAVYIRRYICCTDAILVNAETSLQLGSKLSTGFGVMSDDVSFLSKVFRDSMEIQAQDKITANESTAGFKPMQMKAFDRNADLIINS